GVCGGHVKDPISQWFPLSPNFLRFWYHGKNGVDLRRRARRFAIIQRSEPDMKLLRYGPKGQERPGALDDQGNIRALDAILPDITGATLNPATLKALAAIDLTA